MLRENNDEFIQLCQKCDPSNEVVNIIVWFDGSAFRKTGKSGKIWSMMGMVGDLSPAVRSKLENLVTFFHLGTNMPNNNLFCEKYMDSFENLLNNGLEILIDEQKIQIKFKILLLIADSVAYPKVFNCNQYNGFFGCIKCLHPVKSIKEPRQKRVYDYSDQYPLRSKIMYENAVKVAVSTKNVFQGIKGYSWFSKFMNIPEQFYFDILHIDFHGTFETMINKWKKDYKDENNNFNKFYLNPSNRSLFDQMAIKVRYPNEIKRHQREVFENLGDLKGNEFRNVLFYLVPLFKDFLKDNFFIHFSAYATALRLMCQVKISKDDLRDAYFLMDYFVRRFGHKNMYGLVNMDYKLHVHLHYATQVLNYGSLTYIT
jgi:hypothetical protein